MKDELDNVPQIPQDYGNHVIYGFALALVVALGTQYFGQTASQAWGWAYLVTLVVGTVKKAFDFNVEKEILRTCLGKIAATMSIPLILLELNHFRLI